MMRASARCVGPIPLVSPGLHSQEKDEVHDPSRQRSTCARTPDPSFPRPWIVQPECFSPPRHPIIRSEVTYQRTSSCRTILPRSFLCGCPRPASGVRCGFDPSILASAYHRLVGKKGSIGRTDVGSGAPARGPSCSNLSGVFTRVARPRPDLARFLSWLPVGASPGSTGIDHAC